MSEFPTRVCDLCGGVDDHPRHVVAGVRTDAHPVNELVRSALLDNLDAAVSEGKVQHRDTYALVAAFDDTTSQDRHLDCCAAAGCPTGTCQAAVDAAGGKQGDDLRKHIISSNTQEG